MDEIELIMLRLFITNEKCLKLRNVKFFRKF